MVFIGQHSGSDYSAGTSDRTLQLPKTPLLPLFPARVGGWYLSTDNLR